ncbi:MAG: radical SAM protein [Synergistaceae bacterium]|nr:radical SAM protein [Synergistaceae bacterium]
MTSAMKKLPFFLPFGGCHGRCVYCNQQTITGVSEVPSPEYVCSVLSKIDEPMEICYFGGSFCRFDHETVRAYLDAVVKCAPVSSRIRFSTYPGDLRDTALRRLVMSYPIACVELGIPSLDPNVLSACKRDADPETILEDIITLRDESVPLAVQMMIGLPGQTAESSINDLAALAAAKGPMDWELRLYPCLVLEGTELEVMFQSGRYRPISVPEAVKWGGRFLDTATSLGFRPIRVGLQESELLASQVRGGPHHPALGEMIQSEMLVRKLTRNNWAGPWTVPIGQISKFTGHGGFGLGRLADYTGLSMEKAASLLRYFPPAKCC